MKKNLIKLSIAIIIAAGVLGGQNAGNYVHDNGLINMLPYIPAILGVMYIGRYLEKVGESKAVTHPAAKSS